MSKVVSARFTVMIFSGNLLLLHNLNMKVILKHGPYI